MNIKLLFFFPILVSFQNTNAQTQGYYSSGITCIVQNKNDSAFLATNELKIWQAALTGEVVMYENPNMQIRLATKMPKSSVDRCFKDSFPTKSFTSHYGMVLMSNRSADSSYIMSFSPMFTCNNKNWDCTWPWTRNSAVQFLIPLFQYSQVLPQNDVTRLHNYCFNQFSILLKGKIVSDTIYRFVRFTCDSNEYLPQAPYRNLLEMLKNEILTGQFHIYKNEQLTKLITKDEVEGKFVKWDMTNQVEDPNQPGTFVSSPIKTEGQVKSFLIYEKWIPCVPKINRADFYWLPTPFIGMKRVVCSYGMYLTNGNTIWFSPEDINKDFQKVNFNFIPYEECFRAERFKTLQIQVN